MGARPFVACALWFLCSACTGTSTSVTAPTTAKCEVAIADAPADMAPADGMSGALAITTNRDCTWTATTNAGWISITSATSGQGSESLKYRISPNVEPAPRRGVVQVNNAQVPLVQNAAPCRYSVIPANTAVSANGGDVTVAIETPTGCAWTGVSPVAWITLPANASGDGSGTLTLTVAAHTGTAARTGKGQRPPGG